MDLKEFVERRIPSAEDDITMMMAKEIVNLRKSMDKLTKKIERLENEGLSDEEFNRPILHKVVGCETLHVRAFGSNNATKVGFLRRDDIVYAYQRDKNWYQIDKKGERWVCGDYLEQVVIK